MISSSIGPCDQLLDLLSYQSFDLSVGYRQIKSVPTMLVMLSYSWLIPRAYTITSLVWPMLSPCSLNYGIPFIWKPGWIVVESIDNILISSMILLNIKLVLETCVSIFFMPRLWGICLDERSDFLWFTCIWCKLPSWIRESLFLLLWNHPRSVMHVRSILWSDRLIIFIPYVSLAHQATDWFVQGEGVSS